MWLLHFSSILCIIITLILAVLWYKDPSGNYEPITVAFGAVSAILVAIPEIIRKQRTSRKLEPEPQPSADPKPSSSAGSSISIKGNVSRRAIVATGDVYQFGNIQIDPHQNQPRLPLQRPPRVEHFTGRERELEQLLTDLQLGKVVTLCGPGGIGKSALAAEAIWILFPDSNPPNLFPDGIITHNFYKQPQVALALEAIARAYGEEPRPTPVEAAKRALGGRKALLLLDGTENADNLQAVLDVCGGCGVLITSRTTQDAPSDWDTIAPLPPHKAVELLQAWGKDCAGDEAATSEICKLVGYLPLAVRLVGRYLAQRRQGASEYLTWLKSSPLEALDQGKRQTESVPLLLERSVSQVSKPAQGALAVIGVLALAPFDHEVIVQTLGISNQAHHVLGELVSYGILIRPGERYEVIHVLIHTYAGQRHSLAEGVIQKLAAYYEALAREQCELGLRGYARLDDERVHIMAVLDVCAKQAAWESASDLVSATDDYLDIQGHWTERVQALALGVTAARMVGHRRIEGAFLGNLGIAYQSIGQAEKAIEYHTQALAISREIGDRRVEENRLGSLGLAYQFIGQAEKAIEYHTQALAISREIGDHRGEENHLGNLGSAYRDLEQAEKAIEYHTQALAISREIGDRRGEGNALGDLGHVYLSRGQAEKAIEYHTQALAISREIGDCRVEENRLGNLGSAYRDLKQAEKAIEYHTQALAISREIGDRSGEESALGDLGDVYHSLGQQEKAIEHHTQALVISREIGGRRGEGNALARLGNVYLSLGQAEKAIEYHTQALAISREIGDRRREGNALASLGIAYSVLGQVEKACEMWEQALHILEIIKGPYAESMRHQLASLVHSSNCSHLA